MPSVPSFNNYDELKKAVVIIFDKSNTLKLTSSESLIHFVYI